MLRMYDFDLSELEYCFWTIELVTDDVEEMQLLVKAKNFTKDTFLYVWSNPVQNDSSLLYDGIGEPEIVIKN